MYYLLTTRTNRSNLKYRIEQMTQGMYILIHVMIFVIAIDDDKQVYGAEGRSNLNNILLLTCFTRIGLYSAAHMII